MKQNSKVTIIREYKNFYDIETLLKKIIYTECETCTNNNNNKNFSKKTSQSKFSYNDE